MTSPEGPKAKNGLTLWTLVALVVGNAIGAGLYTTSGFSLADLGSRTWVMLAWLVGGIIALMGAISYGMLSRQLTESGGEYLFLSRSLHPLAGFIAGWISLLAGFTGAISFSATAFEAYARAATPSLAMFPEDTLAIGAIIFAGIVHIVRTRTGAIVHDVIVTIMLVALAMFALYAGFTFLTQQWTFSPPESYNAAFNLSAFAGSLVWISLSYSGFNAAVYVAGEATQARQNVPRAMVIGTVITLVLYLALNAIFLYAPAPSAIAGQAEVAGIAAQALGGAKMRHLVEAIIALSLLTSVTAMILAGPRVYAKMADEGAMPAFFKFHRGAPPRRAIALQVLFALLATIIADLQGLLSYLGFTLSLSLALAVSTLFVRHWRWGERPTSRWYPIAPLLFLSATLVFACLSAWREPLQFFTAAGTFAVGAIAYFQQRPMQKARLMKSAHQGDAN